VCCPPCNGLLPVAGFVACTEPMLQGGNLVLARVGGWGEEGRVLRPALARVGAGAVAAHPRAYFA
jgi:hypothetical protein